MNISFNKVILSYSLGYLFLSFWLIIGLITSEVSAGVLLYVGLFLIFNGMMAILFMLSIKGKVQKILVALSLTIQSLIKDEDNCVFTDIEDSMLSKLQSQVTRLANILKHRNAQIKEEKDNIKRLISDIAHQLKTPLANLNMYESLLLDESLDHDQRIEFNEKIHNQMNKLNWLVQSLVKLSRLETGIIQLTPKSQSIEDTILTAIRQAYPLAENKGIDITFDGDSSLKLNHDDKWTAEALFNIIDNAIKYTKSGGKISISITTYELFARMDIADNGIGLDEHEINDIFKRFYRGKDTEKVDGIGIGLYLAREIITQQGGYMKVKSKKGEGSVFSVFLLVDQ